MTQELANGDVCLLPMKNKICQQRRKVRSRGRTGWIAVALIAVMALFSLATSAQAAWYNSSWLYRKKLTIDYTRVAATLSYFPVLVSLASDTDLAADAQDDGDDILFTSSDGTSKLNHEIELFNGTTGQLVAWVQIPSLSNTADTEIYMYYGNGSAASQQNRTGVWNDNGSNYYKGVWHLNQSFSDSTQYGNNGTNNGTTDIAGKIANGRDFNGSSTSISVADSTSLHISGNLTVEAWVNPDVVSAWQTMVSKMVNQQEDLYFVLDNSTSSLYVGLNGALVDWDSGVDIPAGSWRHVAVTYDGSNIRVYSNGTQGNSTAASGTLSLGTNTNPLYMGYNVGWSEYLDGKLDEVRISNTARSAQWIQTEFNNQNDPTPNFGTFFKSLGSEETNLEQEGFRFRADDGNETGATWLANQDSNISRDKNLNTRLRVVVNALSDPASTQYQLEYKKSTDSTYSNVLTAQPSTSVPTYVGAGGTAGGTGNIAPAFPAGIQTNDILLLFVESGNQTINISNQWGGTWTQAPNSPQGVGTAPGDPATRLAVFWSRYNGTQLAPTVADPGDHAVGRIIAIRGCIPYGDPFDVTAGGTEGLSDTTGSIPGATTTVSNTLVVTAITSHFDTASTTEFSSWTNGNLTNLTERADELVSFGNGGGIGVATGEKASAGAYGATSVTLVNAAYKAMWSGALKPGTQQAILMSASSYIAASGDNTTAQLTPPSGKTTSNFTIGRIQDDENPADAVDITNNYYTELEWCLIATATAQYGDVYQFRVTANGVPLTTYSVTPQWTIAAGSLTLANHALGQAGDAFTTTTPVTAVLFRFNLTRVGTVTVTNLRVNFTTTGGVANADVTNGELYVDNNNDGAIDGGDTLIQSGVTPVSGVLTFTTDFSPGTSGTNYLVRATVSNLVRGDTTTFSVGTADIDEVESGVVESGSISSATHTQDLILLTFNSKYVVTSSNAVTTTSNTLVDDTEASQTFSLAASQTVLVIYNAFNNSGQAEVTTGKQIAIRVDDSTDYGNTYNSPYAATGANGATTFWIGTLGPGSHNIKGRFASNTSGSTVTINERVLLILILDGNGFYYIDNTTTQTTTGATLVNDNSATQAFTPSSACKALILYNVSNNPSGTTEDQNGKYAAINLGGTDYSQFIKSPYAANYSDNVFTLHYAPLSATSYTAQGRFAARFSGATVTISRRQLGVLLFADTALADYVNSNGSVNTTGAYPQNDGQAVINRTTTETRELLVVAAATEDYQTSSVTGMAYGIRVDTNDRTKSRTSPFNYSQNSNNASTAWAETLAAAAHTVQGRYGNNAGSSAVYVTSRRIVALWLVPPLRPLYRSVGTNTGNLNSGGRTVEISGTTATFSGSMPNNIGVGDVLQYQVSSVYYVAFIHGRISDTVYTVKSASGGNPQAAVGGTSVNIYRAYTRLFDWEAQSENTSINAAVRNFDTSTDLVSANTIMNVACYGDGEDTTAVTIDGWTTAASNYIKIYTPVSTSEVGTSQRHSGKWDDAKYRLSPTLTTYGAGAIDIRAKSVRIEGLQVLVNSTNTDAGGIFGNAQYIPDNGDLWISHNIVRAASNPGDWATGIIVWSTASVTKNLTARIWNNIVYDFDDSNGCGIFAGYNCSPTAYVYNNTVYNCYRGYYRSDYGSATPVFVAKNNIYRSNDISGADGYYGTFDASSDYNSSNISGDAPVVAPRNNTVSPWYSGTTTDANIFVAPAGTPRDLHLLSSAIFLNVGVDLSPDLNLAFSDDIDGQSRPFGSVWDIGADECVVPLTAIYRSVGTNANNLNTGGRTVQISGTTATFSGSMPNNVGVGDVLQYEVSSTYYVAFIHGRASDTVYMVKSANGGNPQAAAAGTSVNVYRAYTSLANWQALNENDSINDTVEDFDTSRNLVSANTIMNVACYGDGADTTAVTIDSWTTGTNNYIKIYTPVSSSEVGASQRHNGKWDGSKYRIEAGNTSIINITGGVTGNVRIEGLQIYLNSVNADGQSGIVVGQTGAVNHRISNNIVRSVNGGAVRYNGIFLYQAAAGSVVRIWNNIIYDFKATSGNGIAFYSDPDFTGYVYNNTVYWCGYGYNRVAGGGTVIAKNNISYENTDNYAGTFDSSSTNNLSGPTQTDAPGSNARQGVTVTFLDPSGTPRDLHLVLSDTGAKNYGANLSSDPNLAFSNDIDGETRSGAWDIGADENIEPPFGYRRLITINVSQRGSSCTGSLSNFPVLINLSGGWLKTKTSGGSINSPDGYDIIFRDANLNPLDHEIEMYDGSAGTLVSWVRIPKLFDNNQDTVIYIEYGSSLVTSPTEKPASVWDSNYVGVWHLDESGTGAAGEYKDSTQYTNHGTAPVDGIPIRESAKIGRGQHFNGVDDVIAINKDSELNITGVLTLEAWVELHSSYPPEYQTGYPAGIVGKGDQYQLFHDWDASQRLTFTVESSTPPYTSTSVPQLNTWYHIVGTYDGSAARIYLNGSLANTTATSGALTVEDIEVAIGWFTTTLDGRIDEVRISNVARDACWIGTSHKNQDAPGSFSTVGDPIVLGTFEDRKQITLNVSQRGSSCTGSLSNFPVLINLSADWLKTKANGGSIYSSNGYDIIFRDVNDNQLDHEIEYYNGSGGSSVTKSDGWYTGTGAYTVPAGTNRLLVFVTTLEEVENLQTTITNVTFGGVSMTRAVQNSTYSNPQTWRTEIWYLTDAQIPASGSFVVTYDPTPASIRARHAYALFTNVSQSSPIVDTSSAVSTTDTVTTSPFKVVSGGMAVSGAISAYAPGNFSSVAWGTGWTEGTDQDSGWFVAGTANSSLYGADGTDTGTATFVSGAIRLVIVATSLRPSSGRVVAWVRIPTLFENNQDTVIYMYYGNALITSPTENPAGVWSNNYRGVWHLKESGNGSLDEYKDSSPYANHGQGGKGNSLYVPTRVTGKVSYGQDFNNSDGKYDLVDVGNKDNVLDIPGTQITLEAWVRHNLTLPAGHQVYGVLNHKGWDYGYSLWMIGDQWQCPNTSPPNQPLCVAFNLPGASKSLRTQTTLTGSTWHHVVATYDAASDPVAMRVFIDGVQDSITLSKTDGITAPSPPEDHVWIGHGDQPTDVGWSGEWEGQIDEVRISNVGRSACWIQTQFNNQNSPSTFATIGTGDEFDYKYRKKITILDSMTPTGCTSDLLNFPVLINLEGDYLKTVANGGNISHPYGYDIIFKAQDGETKLDHEIEYYGTVALAGISFVRSGGAGGISGIAVDAISTGSATTPATSITISHTTGSGLNRLMLVGVSINNDALQTVSGITYNGVALTFVGAINNSRSGGDDARVEIWRLINPPPGTYNVIINFSPALTLPAIAGVMTFTGVDQTTPLGTFASAENDPSPATVDVPSAPNDLVFGVVASEYGVITDGQTNRWNISGGSSTYGAGSTKAGASGNVTLTWTLSSTPHWAAAGISIKPASFSFDIGSAGTNRLVVVTAGYEGAGTNLSGVTVDGKACTLIVRAENTSNGANHQEMWYCDEDNLGSSNGNVTVAIQGGSNSWGLHAHLYTGVVQTGPTDYGIDQTSINTTTVTVSGIDVPANGLVVMGAGEGMEDTDGLTVSSWTSPLVQRQSQPGHPYSADLMSASGIETSAQTNKTYIATFSGTFNRGTGIVASFGPASGGSSTGKLVAWVRVPILKYNADTIIYMYYGNPAVASPTANPTGVWDSNYKGVWHLHQSFADSTSSGKHGTNNATTDVAGKIANARNFNEASQYITTPSTDLKTADSFTVSTWFKASDTTYAHHLLWEGIAAGGNGWGETASYVQEMNLSMGNYLGSTGSNNYVSFFLGDRDEGNDTGAIQIYTAFSDTTNWHHVVAVVSNLSTSPSGTLYLDGASVGTNTGTTTRTQRGTWDTSFQMGKPGTAERYFGGSLDEVRISTVVRDACWIGTEYTNQNSPSTSVSAEGEENLIFEHRKQITILNSMTPASCSSNLTNYPVHLSLSGNWLKTAPTGDIYNANGYDIIFKAQDGVTKLDHEIEKYDGTAGTLVAWVRIPTLLYNADTIIYMYYGNSTITISQANPTGVWDSSYKGVWHLKEDPSGTAPQMKDSTSYANHGTSYGTMTSGDLVVGLMDGSLDFDGSDDYVQAPDYDILNAITISAWIKWDAVTADDGIVSKRTANEVLGDWALRLDSSGTGLLEWMLWSGVDTSQSLLSVSAISSGAWSHVVLTFDDPTNTAKIYINGVLDNTTTSMTNSLANTPEPIRIGWSGQGSQYFDGLIDEVRVSNVVRDACWIGTEYTNQSSPLASYTVEGEEFDYKYRKQITIKDSMTPSGCSSDLSNYPVLISLSNQSWLRTKAADPVNGCIENANGYDIIFKAQDGETKLDHEIEKYDGSASGGTLIAWVRIPTLMYNADTIIYMYYGNPKITSPTANPTAVWDYNFKAVWHLKEDPSGTAPQMKDSTSNANNGASTGVMTSGDQVSGQIDGSLDFDATELDYVNFYNGSSLQITGGMTLSAWVWIDSFGTGNSINSRFVTKSGNTGQRGWELNVEQSDSKAYFGISSDGTTQFRVATTGNAPTGQWVHYVGVYEPSTAVRIYVNGILNNSNTTSIPASQYNATNNVFIGERTACSDCYLDGKLDEIRVSNTVRNACWIGTEYKNQYSQADIVVEGVENMDYKYKQQITISKDMISTSCSSDLSNFPVLVSLSGNWLKTKAADPVNGCIENANGYDIIFRDENGLAKLDHEIEQYNGTAGTLLAWVRIPTLHFNDNTNIYIYYGNSAVTSETANAPGVWSNNYRGVWHLKENPAGTSPQMKDSTSNLNHGSSAGSMTSGDQVAGKIDGSLDFDNSDDVINCASGASLDDLETQGGGGLTVSAWIYARTSGPSVTDVVIAKSGDDPDTTNGGWRFVIVDSTLEFDKSYSSTVLGAWTYQTEPNGKITLNTWQHVAMTWDGSSSYSNVKFYLNGTLYTGTCPSCTNGGGSKNSDAAQNVLIANNIWGNGQRAFDGQIDEVRLSNKVRDACWIGTEYNNMNSPATYVTLTPEAGFAPTYVKLTSFKATTYPEGTLLHWKTGYEVDNLGFHIYREENGELVRLTPEPIAGSALLAGSGVALRAGRHYTWWDVSLSSGPSAISHQPSAIKYWLKDIDLSGKETMHGPVTPVFSREPLPEKMNPELLSELGMRLEHRYLHYWKVRELREKLKTENVNRYTLLGKTNNFKTNNDSQITNNKRASLASSSPAGTLLKSRRADPQANEVQKYLAGRPAVKILVTEEGWYQVSQFDLVAAGLSPKVNPRNLQLFLEGREQAIRVEGEENGRFDPGDAIEFYGVGIDTPSTETNVYWLVEGTRPGKRVKEWSNQGGQIAPPSFLHTEERKDRLIYFPNLRNGDEENWFGPVISPSGADQILMVRHLDLAHSGNARLEVSIQGATEVSHQVKVLVNEAEVGEAVFEGQSKGVVQVEVPQALLLEGENLVSFVAVGGGMDVSVLDLIRLSYWHTYTADGDELKFKAQGGVDLTLSGFSHSGVRVFDVTNSEDLVEVLPRVPEGGSYAVKFRVPGRGERSLLAIGSDKVKIPEGLVLNKPSFWSRDSSGYDSVMISHRDFIEGIKSLKQLRESQGLSVALIDLEDVYDEFSFGVKNPKAIKDFLSFAKTKWKKSPRFVVLVGDASFDPKNYYGFGYWDFVPTKLIDTEYLETASDDWFVDFNGDGVPEMAIGRLPVRTLEETNILVSKIISYERSRSQRLAVLVADKTETDDDFDFEGASEEVRDLLPSSVMVSKIYRSQFGSDSQANGVLLASINGGSLLVNFIGHGSLDMWRGILASEDVPGLTNRGLPFFINMTCLNGFFQDPYMDSLAETLIKAGGGGAVGVWTSSGLTVPDSQLLMNKKFIQLLFSGKSLTVGEATSRAKAATDDQDVRKTWIFFGDPATRLRH